MKKLFFFVLALTLSGIASATDLTLSWAAPTSFTNGTAIPASSVITYNVYGANQGSPLVLLQSGITSLTNVRTNVDVGSKCYSVTDTVAGVESAQVSQICVTVAAAPPPQPNAPTNLTCSVTINASTGAVTGACKSQ